MRSLLFIPGDSERKLAKGLDSGADVLLIDLEDSVALDRKEVAREITAAYLEDALKISGRPRLFVRVNAFDTELTQADLAATMSVAPDGIMLPKSESGKDVTQLDTLLRIHEAERGLADGVTAILPIVTETAAGTLACGTYHRSSNRLVAMTWGAEDLSADVGSLERRHPDGRYRDVFRFARVQTLLGAVAAGVAAIDTVFTDIKNEAAFRSECQEAAIDGFTGKMAIHPAQVAIINEIFTPSEEDVERAQAIVDAFEDAGFPGVLAVDGQMLDRPHLRKAQNLLARVAENRT